MHTATNQIDMTDADGSQRRSALQQHVPALARRKVRKGTHTCWACKRRKVRCIFAAPSDTTCQGCVRRCLRCVSQEYPEEAVPATAQRRLVGDRIERVEQMVRQLAGSGALTSGGALPGGRLGLESLDRLDSFNRLDRHESLDPLDTDTDLGMTTPASSCESVAGPGTCLPAPIPSLSSLMAMSSSSLPSSSSPSSSPLTAALLAAFPTPADLDLITVHAGECYHHVQIMFRSPCDIRASGFWPVAPLRQLPSPATPPARIARHMLVLAIMLQTGNAALAGRGLRVPARIAAARLADTAIALVARNDELLDSRDGLECLMLEAVYRGNGGHLRRGWLAWRRALALAQLMRMGSSQEALCVSQIAAVAEPDAHAAADDDTAPGAFASVYPGSSSSSFSASFLWYRLLTSERFMCMLLGLPQSTSRMPVPSAEEAGLDTPLGRLEHALSRITGFVLDRNEHGPQPDDHAATQRVDREMHALAAMMPTRWWLSPDLAPSPSDCSCPAATPGSGPGSGPDPSPPSPLSDPACSSPACPSSSSPSPDLASPLWDLMRLTMQALYYHLLNQLHLPYMLAHPYSRSACVSASRAVLARYSALRRHRQAACCCRFAEYFALVASLTLLLVHIDGHRAARDDPAANLFAHHRLADRAMTEDALARMADVARLNDDIVSASAVGLVRQLLAIEADAAATGARRSLASCADHVQNAGRLRIAVPFLGLVTIASNGEITREGTRAAATATDGAGAQPRAPAVQDAMAVGQPMPASQVDQPQAPPTSNTLDFLTAPSLVLPGPAAGADQWAFQGVDMAFFDNLMREAAVNPGQTWQ